MKILSFVVIIILLLSAVATFILSEKNEQPHIINLLHSKADSNSCHSIIADRYPRQYLAAKTSVAPIIDGNILDDPIWQQVPWTENFVDISTHAVPNLLTKAKIRWDDTHLYVAGYMEEPQVSSNITACCHCLNPAQDQVVFHGNDFEVFVDADGTTHYYKEFEGSPAGGTAYWDICLNKPYQDGGYENSSRVFGLSHGFDMYPELQYAVKVLGGGQINDPASDPTGWTTEIAFPLDKLLYNTTIDGKKPKAGDFWRINFSRVEWKVRVENGRYLLAPSCQTCGCPSNVSAVCPGQNTCDNWVFQQTRQIDIHIPELWAFLQLTDNTTTPKVQNQEWPVRYTAHVLYNAQKSYFQQFGKYTNSIAALVNGGFAEFPQLLSGECTKLPTIELSFDDDQQQHYIASIGSNEVPGMTLTITDDRYTLVHYH